MTLEPVLIWNVGITGDRLTCCVLTLALNLPRFQRIPESTSEPWLRPSAEAWPLLSPPRRQCQWSHGGRPPPKTSNQPPVCKPRKPQVPGPAPEPSQREAIHRELPRAKSLPLGPFCRLPLHGPGGQSRKLKMIHLLKALAPALLLFPCLSLSF